VWRHASAGSLTLTGAWVASLAIILEMLLLLFQDWMALA
jgi:hypothetical protein